MEIIFTSFLVLPAILYLRYRRKAIRRKLPPFSDPGWKSEKTFLAYYTQNNKVLYYFDTSSMWCSLHYFNEVTISIFAGWAYREITEEIAKRYQLESDLAEAAKMLAESEKPPSPTNEIKTPQTLKLMALGDELMKFKEVKIPLNTIPPSRGFMEKMPEFKKELESLDKLTNIIDQYVCRKDLNQI